MTRHYNTKHHERGNSQYSKKHKAKDADKYGAFVQGQQVTADKIAGKSLRYPERKGVI